MPDKKSITNDGRNVVVESRLREVIGAKHKDIRFDGEFFDALSIKALELADQAAARAIANGRSTLRPTDL